MIEDKTKRGDSGIILEQFGLERTSGLGSLVPLTDGISYKNRIREVRILSAQIVIKLSGKGQYVDIVSASNAKRLDKTA